jgi:Bacteriocin-protection, YdeI or OmpD-Associated
LPEINAAKSDGRWNAAYLSQGKAEIPDDLAAALASNKPATRFFDVRDRANRYAIIYRVNDAKRPETRARRITHFVKMLARGESIHPLKPSKRRPTSQRPKSPISKFSWSVRKFDARVARLHLRHAAIHSGFGWRAKSDLILRAGAATSSTHLRCAVLITPAAAPAPVQHAQSHVPMPNHRLGPARLHRRRHDGRQDSERVVFNEVHRMHAISLRAPGDWQGLGL